MLSVIQMRFEMPQELLKGLSASTQVIEARPRLAEEEAC